MALVDNMSINDFDVEITFPWDKSNPIKRSICEISDLKIPNMTIQNSISSEVPRKDFSITFSEKDNDFDLSKWYQFWVTLNSTAYENSTADITARVQTKPFPYRHKTKRLLKKWFKQHNKIVTFYDVKIVEEKN